MPAEIREVLDRDGWRCQVPHCRRRAGLHRHHSIYRSLGGSDDPDQLTGSAKKGFRFRHRESFGAEWGDFPPGGDLPFDPFERAWDGPTYVREDGHARDRAISSFEFSWQGPIRSFRSLRM